MSTIVVNDLGRTAVPGVGWEINVDGMHIVAPDEAFRLVEPGVHQLDLEQAAVAAQRTSIRYVLELYDAGSSVPVFVMPLPMQPAFKNVTKRPGKSLRYTLGAFPIREHTTDRSWTITLGGLVGIYSRPYTKAGGGSTHVMGVQALLEFDAFLGLYQQRASTTGSLYAVADNTAALYDRTFLVFRDFDEGLAWHVEIDSFDWSRDSATTRVANAEWRLSMHAYKLRREATGGMGRSKKRKIEQGPDFVPGVAKLRDNRMIQLYQAAVAAGPRVYSDPKLLKLGEQLYADELEASFAVPSTAGLSDNVRRRIQNLREPFTAMRNYVERLRGYVQSGLTYSQVPLRLFADIIIAGEQLLSALHDVRAAGYDFMAQSEGLAWRLAGLFFETQHQRMEALQEFGGRRGSPEFLTKLSALKTYQEVDAALADDAVTNTAVYTVKDGDTWQSIARKYFGIESPWVFLAAFNGATDAHSLSSGEPLTPGTKVLVPGVTSGALPVTKSADDLYLVDLQIDFTTGDLALGANTFTLFDGLAYNTTEPDQTDLATVGGVANFHQALMNRLLTPQGVLPHLPSYGLMPFKPGDIVAPTVVAHMMSILATQLLQDPRISAVQKVNVVTTGDKIDAKVQVVGLTGKQIATTVPLLG